MTNYYPRRIQPADSLLYDAKGNLVGLRSGTSGDEAIFGLSASELTATQAMVSGAGNIAVTYDGSGRVATLTKGPRSYSYAYSTGSMVITASDGATMTAALDGSNRVTGATGNF